MHQHGFKIHAIVDDLWRVAEASQHRSHADRIAEIATDLSVFNDQLENNVPLDIATLQTKFQAVSDANDARLKAGADAQSAAVALATATATNTAATATETTAETTLESSLADLKSYVDGLGTDGSSPPAAPSPIVPDPTTTPTT